MKRQITIILSSVALCCLGQTKMINYGNMDSWVTREIHESAIIGGNDVTLYEIGPKKKIQGNVPYINQGGSPWGTSNVLAKVSGVTKTNTSVYRQKRGTGYCAKLMTHIESVKVLGLININVLAAGSIFLGDMKEPITGTKDGPMAMNSGVRFTQKPKALVFDYKAVLPVSNTRVKQTGFSKAQTIAGQDYCVATLYLQKRTEDKNGNITAKRIGTAAVRIGKSTNAWVDNATHYIIYGDASKSTHYDKELMQLNSLNYAVNSKGKSVVVKETGWATADEQPTHLILQFSSSHGGAYVGTVGNTLYVDNVRLLY